MEIMIEKKIDSLREEIVNFRSDIFSRMDRVLGELQNMREDSLITNHQVNDHEKRISHLEKRKTPAI